MGWYVSKCWISAQSIHTVLQGFTINQMYIWNGNLFNLDNVRKQLKIVFLFNAWRVNLSHTLPTTCVVKLVYAFTSRWHRSYAVDREPNGRLQPILTTRRDVEVRGLIGPLRMSFRVESRLSVVDIWKISLEQTNLRCRVCRKNPCLLETVIQATYSSTWKINISTALNGKSASEKLSRTLK